MSARLSDGEYMERALFHARRGAGRTTPNPMVGAVVVTDEGVVVGTGYHERAGEPHAEVHALRAAGAAARGATLYCTLEPCCHAGRTGPCTERIVEAGIARLVAGHEDPNPLVAGGGFQYLRQRGLRVEVGTARDEAVRLNAAFITSMRLGRPFITLKIAVSRDGHIAEAPGRRTAITSPAARRHAQLRRAEADAVAVGSETILVDDPELTVREVYRERPLARVVFDRRLRTPPHARLLSTLDQGPVIIMTAAPRVQPQPDAARALEAAGAQIAVTADGSFGSGVACLATLGITAMILEGGTAIQQAAWQAGLVDRLHVYRSPHVLGDRGVKGLDDLAGILETLHHVEVERLGEDTFIEGYVHRVD